MRKKIMRSVFLAVSVVCLGMSLSGVANAVGDMVNVGNKVCPVSGEAIGSMGDAYKVAHEGKEYNLCCKMCTKSFEKNPTKYSEIAEAEVAAQSAHESLEANGSHEAGDTQDS